MRKAKSTQDTSAGAETSQNELLHNEGSILLELGKDITRVREKKKGRVGASWRLDETYIKVKGIWCYLYRAVDKLGNTADFLLTRKRQRMSAQSFLIKAIGNNCRPRAINIDKSCSNTAAIKFYN